MGSGGGAANECRGRRARKGQPGKHVHECVSQLRRCTHMDQGHPEWLLGRSGCSQTRTEPPLTARAQVNGPVATWRSPVQIAQSSELPMTVRVPQDETSWATVRAFFFFFWIAYHKNIHTSPMPPSLIHSSAQTPPPTRLCLTHSVLIS